MIKEGDCILKITYTRREFHIFCCIFCVDVYNRLNWKYDGTSDLNYNIKIGSNRLQYIVSKEKEDEQKLEK
jgi:hypothetical protein